MTREQKILSAQSQVNLRIEMLCQAKINEERARVKVIDESIALDNAKYQLQQAYEEQPE